MKKPFWLAASAVAATAALVAGGTFALFSSETRSADNTFTTGTLCLTSERNDGDTIPGPMFYMTSAQGETPSGLPGVHPVLGDLPGGWAPGDTVTRTLTVYNPTSCSSMNGWLTSVQASLHPGSDADLAEKLWVEVYTPQGSISEVKVGEGRLSDFVAGAVPIKYPGDQPIPIYLTSNRHMKFRVRFDVDADDSYQNKNLVVDFQVNGVQMKNNP